MQCPNDGSTLTMSERSGIEIDYCPQCRGVWLDRGELDKIIDRSIGMPAPAPAAPPPPAAPYRGEERPRYDERSYDRSYQQRPDYRKKRKESWLSELFD